MLSLGFYCKKIPQQAHSDSFNIASPIATASGNLIEIATNCGMKIQRRITERIDIDLHLHKNSEEYDTALEGSAELLASAHYDVDAYRKWATEKQAETIDFLTRFGLT